MNLRTHKRRAAAGMTARLKSDSRLAWAKRWRAHGGRSRVVLSHAVLNGGMIVRRDEVHISSRRPDGSWHPW